MGHIVINEFNFYQKRNMSNDANVKFNPKGVDTKLTGYGGEKQNHDGRPLAFLSVWYVEMNPFLEGAFKLIRYCPLKKSLHRYG